jgi:hypothetical protein
VAPHRSFAKANNPYWSNHVATWHAGHQSAEEYCRRHDMSTKPFMLWARHLLSAEDLRKRKERLRNLRIIKLERQRKKAPSKSSRKAYTYRYNMRTDSEPIAVRAFWGMHVEAMNWSGMGNAEYAAALGLSPYALRIWRNRFADSGEEMDWRSLLHPSARAQLSSAPSCVRRTYRLTPQEADAPVKPAPLQRRTEARDRAGNGEAGRQCVAGLPSTRRRHQHGLPLAGAVRLDRQEGAATGNGGVDQRHGERGAGARGFAQPGAAAGRNDGSRIGRWTPCLCTSWQQFGGGEAAACPQGEGVMIVIPAGVQVHLALGHDDLRKGLDGSPR